MTKTILVATALLLLAGPAAAVLQPDPSRFDLENQEPGAVIERSLTIRNDADTATEFDLEVVRFQDEDVTIAPARLMLRPGESGSIDVVIRLAEDAAGGRHDLRITATEGRSQAAEGVGARSAVRMPIIFHVENLKVASLHIQDALPDSGGNATAMVFNHLPHSADTTLNVLVKDQGGQEVFRGRSDTIIPAEEHRFLTIDIPALPGGAYTIEAWAEHAAGRSNTMAQPYAVGAKSVSVTPARIEALGDGLYRLSADVANAGSIGFDVQTMFLVEGPHGTETIAAPAYSLDPSEVVLSTISARLEPGTYQIVAMATWDGGEASAPPTTYTADQDDPSDQPTDRVIWPYVVGGVAVAAGVAIALVRRRRDA